MFRKAEKNETNLRACSVRFYDADGPKINITLPKEALK